MTTLEAFFADFQNSVRTIAAADGLFTQQAFVQELSNRLSTADVIDSLSACYFDGTASRGKKVALHGYDFGDEDGQIVLAVSDYRESNFIEILATADVTKRLGQLEAFARSALDGSFLKLGEESSVPYQVAGQIFESRHSVKKLRLYLLTNARLGERVRPFPTLVLDDCEIEFHVWDLDRLFRVQLSQTGREEILIDLTELHEDGIDALQISSNDGMDIYLAVVPGDALAQIYGDFGSRILEANVRSFLTARGKVNAAIKGTLLQHPERFLALNNGITATATAVVKKGVGQDVRLTSVQNLQIVNGGQTTASLYFAKRNDKVDLQNVFVAMKLIVVDADEAGELVPLISRSANTQNRVSEADFFSNHPFHQRMEEKSRRMLTPSKPGVHHQTKWFYERTRGQYQNELAKSSAANARRFVTEYPKAQVITKTDAAKYFVTWDQKPHVVSAGAQKNFVAFAGSIAAQWEKDDTLYGETFFQALVCKGIIFRAVRAQVAKAEWYSSGYLANIVAYTVARFSLAVDQAFGVDRFDFTRIWSDQAVPDDLLWTFDSIAFRVFEALTAVNRPVANVTEWAKRETCWDGIASIEVTLEADIRAYILEATEVVDAKRRERSQQHMDSGIAAQVRVMELGSPYWLRLRDFAKAMRALTEKEASIIRTATGESGRLPSEKQAFVLIDLNRRMVDLGFRSP